MAFFRMMWLLLFATRCCCGEQFVVLIDVRELILIRSHKTTHPFVRYQIILLGDVCEWLAQSCYLTVVQLEVDDRSDIPAIMLPSHTHIAKD